MTLERFEVKTDFVPENCLGQFGGGEGGVIRDELQRLAIAQYHRPAGRNRTRVARASTVCPQMTDPYQCSGLAKIADLERVALTGRQPSRWKVVSGHPGCKKSGEESWVYGFSSGTNMIVR